MSLGLPEPNTTGQPGQHENADGQLPEGQLPPLPGDRDWPHPWQQQFLRALSVNGEVVTATMLARVSRSRAYEARDKDPSFRDAWQEAIALSHSRLERRAWEWADQGVPVRTARTVTRRKTKGGVVVEEVTETVETTGSERSATLMIFLLKANLPEKYRWAERVETTGAGGGPVQVHSLASLDEQIAALAAELNGRAVAAGEPVPDE